MRIQPGACIAVMALWHSIPLFSQAAPEEPVGLVLTAQSGKLLRADTLVPLAAKIGDILFQGDSLTSGGGGVSFLYCPEMSSETLSPDGSAQFGANALRIKSGRVTAKTSVSACRLPRLVRLSSASQQHAGISLVRPLVAQVPGAATFEQRAGALPEAQRTAMSAELASLGDGPASRIARAEVFEKYGLRIDAAAEYRKVLQDWPDAVWIFNRLFELEDQPPATEAPSATFGSEGKIYAVVVGISKYKSERINPLLYAARDAELVREFLRSERGGGLPDSDIVTLTDEHATAPAIRLAIVDFLKAKATKNDTILLFIAAHGTVQPADNRAYIVTHEADPENLAGSALAMADLQALFRQQLSGVRRALLFLDTCHAGQLGEVGIRPLNDAVTPLAKTGGEFFSFLASGKSEKSVEGPEFGGGHGAFSFFVVDALNGAADQDRNNQVDFNEFVDYVREMVKKSTRRAQNPKDVGDLGRTIMSEVAKPGLALASWTGGVQLALATVTPPLTRSLEQTSQADPRLHEFEDALTAGRILRDVPQNTFDALRALRGSLTPAQYLDQENRLRVALEEKGRETLLQYLKGEQVPQKRSDFLAGASYFAAAQSLSPESVMLESEKVFCLGRAALFEPKDYDGAANLLERAARLDPQSAYSYNALGIAYLERAEYTQAILAFRDAIRRAPYWVYPVHNLALSYTQTGAYASAIATYRQAMRLAPRASYLRYNLGTLLHKLNRKEEARLEYQAALQLDPKQSEAMVGMGVLYASTGRAKDLQKAETLYLEALKGSPAPHIVRQDLGDLYIQQGRFADAIAVLGPNIRERADFLPSRLTQARAYNRSGDFAKAAQEYDVASKMRPESPVIESAMIENLGDLEKSAQRYRDALKLADSDADRSRIKAKLRRLGLKNAL